MRIESMIATRNSNTIVRDRKYGIYWFEDINYDVHFGPLILK